MDGRVATAMEHVAAVLSAPSPESPPKMADFHSAHREVEEALRAVVDELRQGHSGGADLWSTLIELHQVQRELVVAGPRGDARAHAVTLPSGQVFP